MNFIYGWNEFGNELPVDVTKKYYRDDIESINYKKDEKYCKLKSKLKTNEEWKTIFESYVSIIEKHFESIDREITGKKMA